MKTGSSKSGTDESPPPYTESLFVWILGGWFASMVLATLTLTVSNAVITLGDYTVSWGIITFGMSLIWMSTSIAFVGADEIGMAYFYGIPISTIDSGPKLIPAGILQLDIFPASVIQNQFPDEPEYIQKTDDSAPLETVRIRNADGTITERYKVRPMRITTKAPAKADKSSNDTKNDSDSILKAQMSLEFTFWVRWKIIDPYLFTLATSGSIDETVKQLRDSGESSLNEDVTTRTTDELVSEFNSVQKNLLEKIKADVDGWGIQIIAVGLTAPDITKDVASALQDIPIAKASAQVTRITADAESYRLEKEGQGRAKARTAEIVAEGQGYADSAKIMGVTTTEILRAQVARETVGKGDLILGTEGLAQVMGIGKALLENTKEKKNGDR